MEEPTTTQSPADLQPAVTMTVPENGMSLQIDKLLEALSVAQGQMESASKDVENSFFKSKYADINAVITAAKKPLSDNGLSIIQLTGRTETKAKVTTILGHKSGQFITTTLELAPTKPDAQGMGSAFTYIRRYSYGAIIGMGAEDDDGNAASQKEVKREAKTPPPTANVPATAKQFEVIREMIAKKGKTEADIETLFGKKLEATTITEASKIMNWAFGLPAKV